FRLLSSLSVYVAHRVLPSFPTRRSSDLIISVVIILAFLSEIPWWQVMPFVLLFAYLIFRPLLKALKEMEPKFIGKAVKAGVLSRSEEHTSELQSRENLVCRLLLEKKNHT